MSKLMRICLAARYPPPSSLSTSSVCARNQRPETQTTPRQAPQATPFPTTAQVILYHTSYVCSLHDRSPTTTTRTKKRGRLLSTTKTLPSLPRRPSSHPSSCRRHCRPRHHHHGLLLLGAHRQLRRKRAQMMTKIETVRERVAAVQHRARGWER